MDFIYKAIIVEDADGGFLVTFADVPEAITFGETIEDAEASAQEALGLALRGITQEGRILPRPLAAEGVPIAVDAQEAAKLAVVETFRAAGISKTELARRIGKNEMEVRRILNPDHPTKIGQLQHTMKTMGKTLVVSVMEAAE